MVRQMDKISRAGTGDYVLEVLHPVARIAEGRIAPASRPADLTGKTVGLYWNQKPGGDLALATVAKLLESRFHDLRFRHFTFPFPTAPDDLSAVVDAEVDAIVSTTAA